MSARWDPLRRGCGAYRSSPHPGSRRPLRPRPATLTISRQAPFHRLFARHATTDATQQPQDQPLVTPSAPSSTAAACSRASDPGESSLCPFVALRSSGLRSVALSLVVSLSGASGAGRSWAAPLPSAVARWAVRILDPSPPRVSPPSRWPLTFWPGAGGRGSPGPGMAATSRIIRAISRSRPGFRCSGVLRSSTCSIASAELSSR